MRRQIVDWAVLILMLAALCLVATQHGSSAAPAQKTEGSRKLTRYGMVIRVKPEKLEEYKRLHAAVWADVLKMIKECNIRNYSIFYRDGYLFSYFEYTGTDFKADMAKMAADPTTQRWWERCKPCQQPLDTAKPDEWWAEMEEVFHTD